MIEGKFVGAEVGAVRWVVGSEIEQQWGTNHEMMSKSLRRGEAR